MRLFEKFVEYYGFTANRHDHEKCKKLSTIAIRWFRELINKHVTNPKEKQAITKILDNEE